MCGSEELIHDARQVDLEEMIMTKDVQYYLVPAKPSEQQARDFFVNMSWDVDGPEGAEDMIDAIGTPIQPCADVETVDLSEYMPEYHDQGMGCGLEDRGITDRYDAMGYGWDQALERVCSELPEMVRRTDMEAQVARVAAEKDAEIARLSAVLLEIVRTEPSIYDGRYLREIARTALNEGSAA